MATLEDAAVSTVLELYTEFTPHIERSALVVVETPHMERSALVVVETPHTQRLP